MGLKLPNDPCWTGKEIVRWLRGLGLGVGWVDGPDGPDVVLNPGPYVPDMPDWMFSVTPLPGYGETMDGAGDVSGFQLLTRGPQNDPDAAERMADIADRMIRFSGFPMPVADGGLQLTRVMRSGGGPQVTPRDDDGDRTSLTCNYLTEIMR